ncbi:polysaccharide biosynthesis protein [Methylobacterium nodulans]|uniref:UDP-glucose 4-epimerase n=1 Tax=Methylobacterium nodulans (strain LMG 21967 / CNCM I-2342 / ORS 2060) TaxID=460265 RepID=B8IAC3_METNO|nr:polysaccharide biosynthesis protein [Methylobacterium nodulans]ACL59186.1 polysaccharide biosynthesis protein CapD [Methylobacterium nodulans ORS 2060]
MLSGKTLLITGGTGSFGNAVLARFMKTDVREIRIFSRDEKKQEDLRHLYNDPRMKSYIGDVRQPGSLDDAMRGVDLVFHAAALKQVPSCEFYPMEAVRTNVLGTDNVLNAAVRSGVQRVVLLSTDKAVYPINAMGLSKGMMERIAIAKARTLLPGETVLCITRYGNVMASRGSVIPLFVRQIKEGRDLTVTDPTMTRFMMSLPDSVDLVLHAYEHGQQGDIFVQKAPASTVGDIAMALQRIFEVRRPIQIIGTRHGEKLYESLVSREEMVRSVDTGDFYRIPADARDLNYLLFTSQGEADISNTQDFTSHNTRRLTLDETVELLLKLDYIRGELGSKTVRSEGF